MALIYCPECGQQVSDKAKNCPKCGYPIERSLNNMGYYNSGSKSTRQNNCSQSNSVEDVIRQYLSSTSNRLGIILSISVSVFVLCIVVSAIVGIISDKKQARIEETYNISSQRSSAYSYEREKQDEFRDMQRNLVITVEDIEKNSASTICEGNVRNKGNTTYEFVKVKGSFIDNSGKTIDTGWTYAVGGEGLAPGETTKFSIYVDKNYDIKDCKVTLME